MPGGQIYNCNITEMVVSEDTGLNLSQRVTLVLPFFQHTLTSTIQ